MVNPRDIKTVVDIGANVGVVALRARFMFPEADVIAFEPDDKAYGMLRNNTANLHIKCYQDALGDGDEHPFLSMYNTVVSRVVKDEETKQNPDLKYKSIQTYRLHQLFERYNISPDNCMLKIDCEGAEGWIIGCPEDEAILRACRLVHLEYHTRPVANLLGKQFQFHEWATNLFISSHYINIVTGRQAHMTAIQRDRVGKWSEEAFYLRAKNIEQRRQRRFEHNKVNVENL